MCVGGGVQWEEKKEAEAVRRDEGKGRARQKKRMKGGRERAGTGLAHLSEPCMSSKINAFIKTVAVHVHASSTRLCGGQHPFAAQA